MTKRATKTTLTEKPEPEAKLRHAATYPRYRYEYTGNMWRLYRLDAPGEREILDRNLQTEFAADNLARREAERTGGSYDGRGEEVAGAVAPELGIEFPELRGTIGELEAALDKGAYDDVLDELMACEVGSKNRLGAKRAIEARRAESEE